MRKIEQVIVHVTDSPDTMDIGAAEIDQWHRQRGFKCIGYHYVVRRSGTVETGRPEEMVGAHCEGENYNSLGVVWVGKTTPAPVQYAALAKLLARILSEHALTLENVHPHSQYSKIGKTCPNLTMPPLLERVKEALASMHEVCGPYPDMSKTIGPDEVTPALT